jgi:predicted XRE-type DNA-binding protein
MKRAMPRKRSDEVKVIVGSGNVFADLGLTGADELLLKSNMVIELRRLIKSRKLTQTAAAKTIGISQPDLSHLLKGRFRGYSVERLMRMLTAFDRDVEIRSRPRARKNRPGRITFTSAAA